MYSIDQILAQLNENVKRLDKEIDAMKKRHEEELAPLLDNRAKLETSIVTIKNTINHIVCHRCGGSGTIRVCDAAGQMDDEIDCPDCRGTGVITH